METALSWIIRDTLIFIEILIFTDHHVSSISDYYSKNAIL